MFWPPPLSIQRIFLTHAKADPGNGIPRLSLDSVFEVVVDGKIHRVEG